MQILLNLSSGYEAFKKMVNQRNNDGCTPLFVAIQHKNIKMIKFLMDENKIQIPDITLKNKNGETMKEYIERNS